jgi:hypothetical protein
MRILCVVFAIILLSCPVFAADPSGADGKISSGAEADLNPAPTLDYLEVLSHRVEYLNQLGRTTEASELQAEIDRLAPTAVPAPEREEVIPELMGGEVATRPSGGSMITFSPWAEDQLIYQGNYSYSAWQTIERGQPFDVDYDSLGNIYAAVALADSTIHLFESTDNGVTWVDHRTVAPGPPAYLGNVRLLVSDDGDSAIAYLFYIWTGGGGGNLWCNVTNISTWTFMREHMLDAAAADSIVDFSVTRDHYWGEGYIVYADYQEGEGDATIYFTTSANHGGSWTAPVGIQFASGDPCLAYGGYGSGGNLYRAYTYLPSHPDSSWINVRRSTNYGGSWDSSVNVRDGDSGDNTDPQVAAAHTPRANQMVWCTYTTNYQNSGNLQLWCSRSTDGGANWYNPPGPSYVGSADEFGSSINVFRADNQGVFQLAYIYDDTATTTLDSIRVQSTDADTWPASSTSIGINDSAYAANSRPVATFSSGLPGVAYAGAGGVNVYYDNVWYVGTEESEMRARTLSFELLPNRPNPFSSRTTIQYAVPAKADVSLKVYDVSGRLVRTLVEERVDAGLHAAVWDGTDESGSLVSNGVYFYRLLSPDGVRTNKLNLIR